AIWRDHAARAEHDRRGGSRESREQNAGAEREDEQTGEGLDRHDHVRRHAVRDDVPVADRRQRFDAEEERAAERAAGLARRNPVERARTAGQVEERKEDVRGEVARGDQREESWPADREEKMVRRQPREKRKAAAARIERAVAVEESLFVDASND